MTYVILNINKIMVLNRRKSLEIRKIINDKQLKASQKFIELNDMLVKVREIRDDYNKIRGELRALRRKPLTEKQKKHIAEMRAHNSRVKGKTDA